MLGAPMWTRICNLQMETGLPPLTARVKQITVATLAKICRSSKPSTTKVKIRVAYHRDQRTRGTSWLHMAANIIHAYRAETSTLQTEDAPHHRYSLPPPWDPPPATFEVTALGDKKSSLQQEDIRRLSLRAIATETPAGAVAYFTDGSVDQTDERRSGAAFHTQVHTRLWRLPNGCSTLQTEPTAISKALEHAATSHSKPVIIHTDSKSSVQTLEHNRLKDNIKLLTSTLSQLQELQRQGSPVTIHWISSHVGIEGNETADEAAEAANTSITSRCTFQ